MQKPGDNTGGKEGTPASPSLYKDDFQDLERRRSVRKPLKLAVLAFFGENDWGKLVNLSENGMSFEFSQSPPLRQRISFTFEVMACMTAQLGWGFISDSFQASGEIVWKREFERTAGVRFLDLDEGSRKRIANWLSFATFTDAVSVDDIAECEEEVLQEATREPLPPSLVTSGTETSDALWSKTASTPAESVTEQVPEPALPPQPETLWAPLGVESYSKPWEDEARKPRQAFDSEARMSRKGLMALASFLTVLVVIAGVRMGLFDRGRSMADANHALVPSARAGEAAAAHYQVASESNHPFLVEVLDANNRRSFLRFDRDASSNMSKQVSRTPAPASLLASPSKKTTPLGEPVSAKAQPDRQFTFVTPKATGPETANLAVRSVSAEAPAVPNEAPITMETMPLAGILTSSARPSPVDAAHPVGGEVQMARLIRSQPPVYPAAAKWAHVTGDVTVDALIDSTGTVKDTKSLSGPILLRLAAMDAVRQWKYEPARLDGKPVPLHLTVIIKFRIP
jgi:protein TonB